MARNAIIASALTAAFAASIGFASPAQALEPKQCLPMAEMNVALKAEGQRTLIIGDRSALNDAPERSAGVKITKYVNTVTSSQDGSRGYQLEGDLPRNQQSNTVCVRAKLTNVQLFDARRQSIPKEIFLGDHFDNEVRRVAAGGVRPMIQADTVQRAADGSERLGAKMVMFGNVPERAASLYARSNGEPKALMLMVNTDYTPAALDRLGVQVALRAPN